MKYIKYVNSFHWPLSKDQAARNSSISELIRVREIGRDKNDDLECVNELFIKNRK